MNDDLPYSDELTALRTRHRALDAEIAERIATGAVHQIELARLKKEKLRLKDRIEQLADLSTPDIIA